jgi:hypothetical protein
MDGFKDSTKTQFVSGGTCFAKGGAVVGPRGAAAASKGFAQAKRGPAPKVVKKAEGGPVKKADGGFLKGALQMISPLGASLAYNEPLNILPGVSLAKRALGIGKKPAAVGATPGVLSSAGAHPAVEEPLQKASGGEVKLRAAQKLNSPSPVVAACSGGAMRKAEGGAVKVSRPSGSLMTVEGVERAARKDNPPAPKSVPAYDSKPLVGKGFAVRR